MPSCIIGPLTDCSTALRRLTGPQFRLPSLAVFTIFPSRPQYGPSGVSTFTPLSPLYVVVGVTGVRLPPRSRCTPWPSPAAYTTGVKAEPTGTVEVLALLKPCFR